MPEIVQLTTSTSELNSIGYEFPASSGHSSTGEISQSFVAPISGTLVFDYIVLDKFGSPGDNTILSIQGDNSGEPNNIPIITASFPSSGLNTSPANYVPTIDTMEVVEGTKYHVVLKRSGSYSDTSGANTCGHGSAVGGQSYKWRDSTTGVWSADKAATINFHLTITSGPVAPTVTNSAASSITSSAGTLNGDITDTGGENADERGFVFGTTTQGAPGDVAPASAGYDDTDVQTGDFGVASFTASLTGLTASTRYYFRAYAHNSAGYTYSDELYFDTSESSSSGRRLTNKPGVTFDAEKTTVLFAEDINDILDRLDALEG